MGDKLVQKNGLDDLVSILAKNSVKLERLSIEDLKRVGKAAVFHSLEEELRKKVETRKVDYQKEKEVFLRACRSKHTRLAYWNALDKLEVFADTRGGVVALRG